MVLTRKQFAEYFNSLKSGLGDDDSPLWEGDHDLDEKCNYFISVPPRPRTYEWKLDFSANFWCWAADTLKGCTRCFSAGDDEEWWGFTHKEDIILFLLRWS